MELVSKCAGPPPQQKWEAFVKIWIAVLKVFGYIWITLAALLIGVGIIGVWMEGGFSAVQDLMSPFNLVNAAVTIITLAPGMAAVIWAENLSKKVKRQG